MREFEQILLNDDFTKPLAAYCSSVCPNEVGNCTGLLYTALGGYEGLLRVRSPLQSVISDDVYFLSAQFKTSLSARVSGYSSLADKFELGACTVALANELDQN